MNNERIILDSFLLVGDRVIANYDEKNGSWEYGYRPEMHKIVPNRMGGVVVAFGASERYYGHKRRQYGTGKHGVFQHRGCAYVRWDNGLCSRIDPHHTSFEDPTVMATRDRAVRFPNSHEFTTTQEVRIRELPDLPYVEGDVIRLAAHCSRIADFRRGLESIGRDQDPTEVVVDRIDYYNIDQKNDAGGPMPLYSVIPVGLERKWSGQTIWHGEDAGLIRRGNHWLHEHGEPTSFNSLEDEIQFEQELHRVIQLRNPKRGDYRWELNDVLTAIKNDEADAVSTSGSWFGNSPFPTAHRFINRDVGERVRQKTLAGFKIPV